MKISTIKNKFYKIFGVLFWLIVWEVVSRSINQNIIISPPTKVLKKLSQLIFIKGFYISIYNTFINIVFGFFIAVLVGIFFSALSYKTSFFSYLLEPLISIIKSVPVVSFIIISLFFLKAKNLSIFISFLMTLPIIYTNVFSGLKQTDRKMIEMAKVFKVSSFKKIKYIYMAQVFPFFISACKLSLGLSFKSGIAAEVIGLPKNTIGENLYNAKIYLITDEVFAWTIVIVLVSFLFEKMVVYILNLFDKWE